MKIEAFRIEVDGKQQTLKSIDDIKKAIRDLRKSSENLDLTDPDQAKKLNEVNKTIGQLDATVKQNTKSQRDFKEEAVAAGRTTATAYQRFQAELKTTRSSLRDLEAAGKGNTDEAKQLRTRLSELNDEQRRINRETKAGSNAYRQLTSQLAATQDRIKQLNAQKVLTGSLSRKETAELARLQQQYTKLNGSVRQIEQGVGQFQRSVGQYQNALRGVAGAFNAAALAGGKLVLITETLRAIVRFAKDAFNTFSEFSGAVQFLGVVSGSTESEITALREEAERLGASTAFTASEVVGLQTTFARGGFDATEIINLGEATLNLASATQEALEPTSDLVSIISNVYKTSAQEAREATDALVGAFNNSTLQLSSFTEAFTNVGGTAALANIEFEATAASLGVLSDAGERGSRAGTRLGIILTDLANENSKLSKEVGFAVTNTEEYELALDKLAESGLDLTKANELVSGQNARVLATLVQNRDGYNELRGSIGEATEATDQFGNTVGAAALAAEKALDSLAGDQRKLASATEGLKIQFASLFEGGSRGAVQGLTAVASVISNSIQPAFALFQSIIEPVREAVNELVQTIIEVINPIGQVEGQVNSLQPVMEFFIGAIKLQFESIAILIRAISRLIRIFKSVQQVIGTGIGLFKSLASQIINTTKPFRDFLTEVEQGENKLLALFATILKFPFTAIKAAINFLGRIPELFLNIPNVVGGILGVVEQVGKEIERFFKSLPLEAEIAAKSIKGLFSSSAREEVEQLKRQREQLAGVGKTLGERFSAAWNEGFGGASQTIDRAKEIQDGLEESVNKATTKKAAEELMKGFRSNVEAASREELEGIKESIESQLEGLDLTIPANVEQYDLLQQQLAVVEEALSGFSDEVSTAQQIVKAAEGSIGFLKNELSELTKTLNDSNLSETELEAALQRVLEVETKIEEAENRIIEARNRLTREVVEPVQLLQPQQISGGDTVEVSDDARREERLRLALKTEAEIRSNALQNTELTEQQRFEIIERSEERIKALRLQLRNEELNSLIARGELLGQALLDAQRELIDNELELNAFKNEEKIRQDKEAQSEIEQVAKDGAKRIFDGVEELRKERVESEIQSEKDKYNALIEAAEGNEERQERLAEERDERVEELQREQFERGKKIAIAQTLINAAQAVIATLSATPGPVDILSLGTLRAIQIAAIAGTTATQIAAIAGQQFGEGGIIYNEGGMLEGKSHAEGGIKAVVKGRPIEMEGGEAVINKRTMRSRDKISLHGTPREIASSLNSYKNYGVKFAKGGLVGFENGGILAGQETPSADAVSGYVRLKQEDIRAIAQAVRDGSTEGTIEGSIIAAEEKNRINERVRRLELNTSV